MSRGVNKVILLGNCGNDPDTRFLPNGSSVANVSLATSESWKGQDGEKKERTTWHRLVFYSPLADVVGKYVRKGTQIYVEGRIQTSQYEKDGITRYSTDIICREMQLLGGNRADMGYQPQGQPQTSMTQEKTFQPPKPSDGSQSSNPFIDSADDLPF